MRIEKKKNVNVSLVFLPFIAQILSIILYLELNYISNVFILNKLVEPS